MNLKEFEGDTQWQDDPLGRPARCCEVLRDNPRSSRVVIKAAEMSAKVGAMWEKLFPNQAAT